MWEINEIKSEGGIQIQMALIMYHVKQWNSDSTKPKLF